MRVFAQVVDSGSFARASDRLGLSTTATSRLVGELENHLGTRLLQRTTRHINLTEAGRSYLDRCIAILAEIDAAEQLASSATQQITGVLRISAPVAFGARHLGPLIARFCEIHPELVVDITLVDRQVDLVEESFDLAIRITHEVRTTLVARRLALAPLLLVASPAYLDRYGRPRTPADLQHHRCLGYVHTRGGVEWELIGPDGPHLVPVRGPLRSNNGELMAAASMGGMGITMHPLFITGEAISRGELEVVLPAYLPRPVGIHAFYQTRLHLSAKVRGFVDFLADNMVLPDHGTVLK
jgi:DNA-binding transcriptional LysR family regulator